MIDKVIQDELRAQYNPDGSSIRNIQLVSLEVLKEIDRICLKNDIKYILSSGTLLGAVRHRGFIPWDDDVDIEMLKEDYDKFLSVLDNDLSEDFVVHSYANDPYFIHPFIKIREKKCEVFGTHPISRKYNKRGCFVDVFPIQEISHISFIISRFLFRKLLWSPLRKYNLGLNYITCVRRVLIETIFPILTKLTSRSKKSYHHIMGSTFKKTRKLEYFTHIKRIKFENEYFNAPEDSHGYLTDLYGNYMELPQAKQGHNLNIK